MIRFKDVKMDDFLKDKRTGVNWHIADKKKKSKERRGKIISIWVKSNVPDIGCSVVDFNMTEINQFFTLIKGQEISEGFGYKPELIKKLTKGAKQ